MPKKIACAAILLLAAADAAQMPLLKVRRACLCATLACLHSPCSLLHCQVLRCSLLFLHSAPRRRPGLSCCDGQIAQGDVRWYGGQGQGQRQDVRRQDPAPVHHGWLLRRLRWSPLDGRCWQLRRHRVVQPGPAEVHLRGALSRQPAPHPHVGRPALHRQLGRRARGALRGPRRRQRLDQIVGCLVHRQHHRLRRLRARRLL